SGYRTLNVLDGECGADVAVTEVHGHRIDRGDLGDNPHEHLPIRHDLGRDLQDDTDLAAIDVLLRQAGGRKCGAGHDRDFFADVDNRGLVIQRHDLRSAEDVQTALHGQGTDQQAETVARCREDEAADAVGGRDAAHAEVVEALVADDGRVDHCI